MIRLHDPTEREMRMETVLAKSTVRMKLYPHTKSEEIEREAATHLYQLLQQYNWSLEDPLRYQERWAAFWPSLSDIERKALALLVMSNSNGNFGVRISVSNLPVDLEAYEGQVERVVMYPRVEQELRSIVGRYYASLVSADDISNHWSRVCAKAYSAVTLLGGAALAYNHEGLLIPGEFDERCRQALATARFCSERVQQISMELDASLQKLLVSREEALWKQS